MKNNKGFTIVELLAVVVILGLLSVFAITNVLPQVRKGEEKTFANDATVISQGAINKYSEERLNKSFEDDIFESYYEDTVCYSIQDSLLGSFVSKDDDSYHGSVEVCSINSTCIDEATNKEYRTKIWLSNGEYYLDGILDDNINYKKIEYSSDNEYFDSCGKSTEFPGKTHKFNYTGTVQEYIANYDGKYRIEVWGAQGGSAGEYLGGYGGYSTGEITLNKDDKLYIVVGGAGAQTTETTAGGYNGGGASGKNNAGYRGTGGGATSVAYKSGVLNSLSSSQSEVIIVAGGGGGANVWNSQYGYGGAGGGFTGMNGTTQNHTIGTGGTQTAGGTGYQSGTFGQGASAPTSAPGGAGGGGGYFGGGSSRDNAGAGGGSGYIGFESLSNKSMYCYNCTESSAAATKTISTTCVSELPTENCAKAGNGYAKIYKVN